MVWGGMSSLLIEGERLTPNVSLELCKSEERECCISSRQQARVRVFILSALDGGGGVLML